MVWDNWLSRHMFTQWKWLTRPRLSERWGYNLVFTASECILYRWCILCDVAFMFNKLLQGRKKKKTNGAPPQKLINTRTKQVSHKWSTEWVCPLAGMHGYIQTSLTMTPPINFIHPFIRSFNHFINEKKLNDESDMNKHFSLSDQILVALVTVVQRAIVVMVVKILLPFTPNGLSIFWPAMWIG